MQYSYATIKACFIEVIAKVLLMEELKDIIGGLEQRINAYKSKLQDLQRKKDKLEDEINTIKKYLELAETLYRVELDKAKISPEDLSNSPFPDNKEKSSKHSITVIAETTEEARDLLFGKSKYAGLSVPQAAFLLLKDKGKPMHAKEIFQKLIEGGIRIRGKTPVTSVSISLNRDKRFKKVAPNTFDITGEKFLESAN
jgi:hypothetical protein